MFEQQTETIIRKGMGYKNEIDWGDECYENFKEQQRKYKCLIQEILENYNKATNNDVILIFEFWNLMGQMKITESADRKEVIVHIKKEDVPFITSPETITRIRRILNSKNIGLPTNKEVFLRRMKRQESIRKYFGKNKE